LDLAWRFESPHLPLPLPGRLVRDFGPVVETLVLLIGSTPSMICAFAAPWLVSLSVTSNRGTYRSALSSLRKSVWPLTGYAGAAPAHQAYGPF